MAHISLQAKIAVKPFAITLTNAYHNPRLEDYWAGGAPSVPDKIGCSESFPSACCRQARLWFAVES